MFSGLLHVRYVFSRYDDHQGVVNICIKFFLGIQNLVQDVCADHAVAGHAAVERHRVVARVGGPCGDSNPVVRQLSPDASAPGGLAGRAARHRGRPLAPPARHTR